MISLEIEPFFAELCDKNGFSVDKLWIDVDISTIHINRNSQDEHYGDYLRLFINRNCTSSVPSWMQRQWSESPGRLDIESKFFDPVTAKLNHQQVIDRVCDISFIKSNLWIGGCFQDCHLIIKNIKSVVDTRQIKDPPDHTGRYINLDIIKVEIWFEPVNLIMSPGCINRLSFKKSVITDFKMDGSVIKICFEVKFFDKSEKEIRRSDLESNRFKWKFGIPDCWKCINQGQVQETVDSHSRDRFIVEFNEPKDLINYLRWDNKINYNRWEYNSNDYVTGYFYKKICDKIGFKYKPFKTYYATELKMKGITLSWNPSLEEDVTQQKISLNDQIITAVDKTCENFDLSQFVDSFQSRNVVRIQTSSAKTTVWSESIEVLLNVSVKKYDLLDDELPADIICNIYSGTGTCPLFEKYPDANLFVRCPNGISMGSVFVDMVKAKKDFLIVHLVIGMEPSNLLSEFRNCLDKLAVNPLIRNKTIAFPPSPLNMEKSKYIVELEKFALKIGNKSMIFITQ